MRITDIISKPRSTARGLITAVAVAALAVGALATQAQPASAAATLSLPANPVVVPWSGSTTSTTLSWNLGGIPKAQLKVQENGGAIVLSQAVASQTGSAPLTVTIGKTYTATLNDAVNPATVLATLSITTKRPPITIEKDCSTQCITGVTVDPHGTFANFHITTNELAHFQVEVSTAAPNANHVFANVTSATFNLSNVTDWSTHLLNLTANTNYFYVVKATDAQGHSAYKEGQFKTLKRRVFVLYQYVHMIDDSDNGDGAKLSLWFLVNKLPEQTWDGKVPSGATIFPPVAFTDSNAPDTLKLRVTGVDYDGDCESGHYCLVDVTMPDGNGADSQREWSTVKKSIILPTGLGEATGGEFDMTTTAPLKFKVHGSYIVSYVP